MRTEAWLRPHLYPIDARGVSVKCQLCLSVKGSTSSTDTPLTYASATQRHVQAMCIGIFRDTHMLTFRLVCGAGEPNRFSSLVLHDVTSLPTSHGKIPGASVQGYRETVGSKS